MNLLLEIRDSDILPGAQNKDPTDFLERHTARAVIRNSLGNIALLHVGKYDYHKLPGGGIENGETIQEALARELQEEIGCKARILTELGVVIEYKNNQARKQISYCYLGEQVGEIADPTFTAKEQADGCMVVWSNSIDTAIDTLESDKPFEVKRQFARARELAFLRAAQQLITLS